jgi:hypothetical protein
MFWTIVISLTLVGIFNAAKNKKSRSSNYFDKIELIENKMKQKFYASKKHGDIPLSECEDIVLCRIGVASYELWRVHAVLVSPGDSIAKRDHILTLKHAFFNDKIIYAFSPCAGIVNELPPVGAELRKWDKIANITPVDWCLETEKQPEIEDTRESTSVVLELPVPEPEYEPVPKSKPKPKSAHLPGSAAVEIADDSIIDVTPTEQGTPAGNLLTDDMDDGSIPETKPQTDNISVPYWGHRYVYSCDEIEQATPEQKCFYYRFRDSFLNDKFLDLQGNMNYAFVLLFDLLRMYGNRADVAKLENRIKALGQHYPRTRSYGVRFLIEQMEKTGNYTEAERIKDEEYNFWKLGSKYRAKLNLTAEQSRLLNNLSYSANKFSAIECCMTETIKLYLAVIDALKNKYMQEGDTFESILEKIAVETVKQQSGHLYSPQVNRWLTDKTIYEVHSNIFKYCENATREFYGYKRKTGCATYPEQAQIIYETKIIAAISEVLPALLAKIPQADEETEIKLNTFNTTRWKNKFEALTENYSGNSKDFANAAVSLGKLNGKNPSAKMILFEAAKFMVKHDKETSVSLYLRYMHENLNSTEFKNRQLPKSMWKTLFETGEQQDEFTTVANRLIQDRDLGKALRDVPGIYAAKRKKIRIDAGLVEKVQNQHSETVELLNEYLNDEEENSTNEKTTAVPVRRETPETAQYHSIYADNISFTEIQTEMLEMFAKNNFTVSQFEIEAFAKSKGVFKNQLIESINEMCYEHLDDVLIEENVECYLINPDYHQAILLK